MRTHMVGSQGDDEDPMQFLITYDSFQKFQFEEAPVPYVNSVRDMNIFSAVCGIMPISLCKCNSDTFSHVTTGIFGRKLSTTMFPIQVEIACSREENYSCTFQSTVFPLIGTGKLFMIGLVPISRD